MTTTQQPTLDLEAGKVVVTVSGLTGTGKSAVIGEIEIALRALGVPVEHDAAFQHEKNGTHADWQAALDLYKPTVVIREVSVSRAALEAAPRPSQEAGEEARYAALGRACEGNGLAHFDEAGKMLFQPPEDMISEAAYQRGWNDRGAALTPAPGHEAEPVAWKWTNKVTGKSQLHEGPVADLPFNRERWVCVPLYAHPAPAPAPDVGEEG